MSKDIDPVIVALKDAELIASQSEHPSASYTYKAIGKAIAIQKQQAKVIEAARTVEYEATPMGFEEELATLDRMLKGEE